jgi:hypothetical protein
MSKSKTTIIAITIIVLTYTVMVLGLIGLIYACILIKKQKKFKFSGYKWVGVLCFVLTFVGYIAGIYFFTVWFVLNEDVYNKSFVKPTDYHNLIKGTGGKEEPS